MSAIERHCRAGFLRQEREAFACFSEFSGVGALERIDRLLFVTDREERPTRGTGADIGKEFAREAGDDVPLLGACVLSFIDEDVVQTAVELIKRPLHFAVVAGKEGPGLQDEIVEIERAAGTSRGGVVLQDSAGNSIERDRCLGERQRLEFLRDLEELLLRAPATIMQARAL